MVAENDYGVAQLVDEISHSKVWGLVGDLRHRGRLPGRRRPRRRAPHAGGVISPYAKRGAVIHTRYDMLSVIRSMELIIGHAPARLRRRGCHADV